jgi:hypothetical protein
MTITRGVGYGDAVDRGFEVPRNSGASESGSRTGGIG